MGPRLRSIDTHEEGRNEYNIIAYGAVGDSETVNTPSIQAAIDDAHNHGGGRIVIPEPGVFLTGSLVLQSNIEIYIEAGATLLGSTNRNDYKFLSRWMAVLMAENASNIKLTGENKATSVIDGQGRQLALNINELYHQGKIVDPDYSTRRHRTNERQRPQIVEFINCHNVQVSNVQIRNSSCWVQTYKQCTELAIFDVIVDSDAYWNNDGIDVLDCRNVEIYDCDINAADDGICLKSYDPRNRSDEDDPDDLLGVYNVSIRDCRIRSSASGVKLGTTSNVAFQKVSIHNVLVYDTYRSALAIESVDGAVIEDVIVTDLVARNTGNPLFLRLGKRATEGGSIRRVRIKNVVADVPFGRPDSRFEIRGPSVSFLYNPFPCSIVGIPERLIDDILLENIDISFPGRANKGIAYMPLTRLSDVPENATQYPEYTMFEELPAWSFYIRHASNVKFENIRLRLSDGSDFRPAFVADDVNGLDISQVQLPVSGWQGPQYALRNVRKADLSDIEKELIEWIDS